VTTDQTTTTTSWWDYVDLLMRAERINNAELANAIGVTPGTVGRWKLHSVDAKSAVLVARHFRRPVGEALARAGIVHEDELGYSAPPLPEPNRLTNDQLVSELLRRLRPDEAAAASESPAEDLTEAADAAPATRTVRKRTPNRS
jgi:hypothetical protein